MDINFVVGDDEYIDVKIFWFVLKKLYKEKYWIMYIDNKEMVFLKLNKFDYWCMKKKYLLVD